VHRSVNDLLDQLQASAHGLRIGDLALSASTQADDIVLVSMSRNNLGALLKSTQTSGGTHIILRNVPR